MEVTQQAASKAVAELIDLGIVEATTTTDRRAKRIRLSRTGWQSVRLGRLARFRIDRRLENALGNKNFKMARSILLTCLRAVGGWRESARGGCEHLGRRPTLPVVPQNLASFSAGI